MQASLAGPQGGEVVRGEGRIVRPNATTTNVNQASQRLVVDWDTFNVAGNETVNFNQPSADASVLNRIFDQNPSEILGTINANGRVLLVNPNGLLFGRSASVNVGSLIASGLNIDADDFMNGGWSFGGGDGMVINRGLLQAAEGGSVSLFGGAVQNEGAIIADFGTINLAAGKQVTIDFDGDGLIRFAVDGEVIENAHGVGAAVSNSGTLQAESGSILLSANAANDVFAQVVNNSGVISASGVVNDGGRVFLTGTGGDVVNSGVIEAASTGGDGGSIRIESDADTYLRDDARVDADSATGSGGSIEVLGDRVALLDRTRIDASGSTGGGEVRIGGDYLGGGDLPAAKATVVAPDVVIDVSAGDTGDGGTAIVWSDDVTRFHGHIDAQGGAQGGDGGFVETSGKAFLESHGSVDASAPHGQAGTWLLDPHNVTITNAQAGGTFDGGDPNMFTPTADDATVNVANIVSALNGGTSVIITTGATGTQAGDITVASSINSATPGAGVSLTLDAANDIIFDTGGISDSGSGLGVVLLAGGNISLNQQQISTGAGDITMTAGGGITLTAPGSSSANLLTTSGNISLTAQGGGIVDGNNDVGNTNVNIQTTSGAVSLSATGGIGTAGGEDLDLVGVTNLAINAGASVNVSNSIALANLDLTLASSGTNTYAFDIAGMTVDLIDSGSGIDVNNVNAGGSNFAFSLDSSTGDIVLADGAISTGAGGVMLTAAGAVTDGDVGNIAANIVSTGGVTLTAGTSIGTAGEAVDLDVAGAINASATNGAVNLHANSSATFGTVTATGDVSLSSNDSITTGSVVAGGSNTISLAVDTDNNGASTLTLGGTLSGGTVSLAGSGIDDTLAAGDAVNAWSITGTGAGTLNGGGFTGFDTLQGGSDVDTFTVSSAATMDLLGGAGADVFNLDAALTGTLNGEAGSDTLQGMQVVDVTLTGSDANGFDGTTAGNVTALDGIDVVVGAGTGTLTGDDVASTWTLDGTPTYTDGTSTLDINGFAVLQGGSGIDTFAVSSASTFDLAGGAGADVFDLDAVLTGMVNGEAGSDTLQGTQIVNVTLTGSDANGFDGTNAGVTGGFDGINVITGAGTGTLTGINADSVWDYDTALDGTYASGGFAANFNGFANTSGGSGADTFNLDVDVTGTVDGGAGADVFALDADVSGTLIAGTGNDTFNVNVSQAGGLSGGDGDDSFVLADAVTVAAGIAGDTGADTISWAAYAGTTNVTLTGSAANGFNGSGAGTAFTGIGALVGGTGGGTLTGADTMNTWTLDVTPTYSDGTTTLAINGFDTLQGGSNTDTFTVSSANSFDLLGGAGIDIFNLNAVLTGTLNGEAGSDTLQGTQIVNVTLTGSDANGFDGTNTAVTGGFDGIDVIGGAGSGTLTGDDVASTWVLDGTPIYSDGVNTLAIIGFDTLQGGSGIDTFSVSSASTFDLLGGAGADVFDLDAVLTGMLNGEAGSDTLQGAQVVNVTLTGSDASGFGGTNSGVTGDFGGIDAIVGAGTGTLTGDDVASTWTLDGTPTYSDGAGTLAINGFVALQGGTNVDTFNVAAASVFNLLGGAGADVFDLDAVLTGMVNGEAGSDTLQGTQIVDVTLTGSDANGFDGTNTGVSGGFDGIDVIAGAGAGTLTGDDVASTWTITGADAGTYVSTETLTFSNFASLAGGSGDDAFVIGSSGSLAGGISGGGETAGDSLAQTDGANSWDITGTGAGTVTDVAATFAGIESVTGGSGADTFDFSAAAAINVAGGAGADVFNLDQAITGNLDGGDGDDRFNALGGTFSGIVTGGEGGEVDGDLVSGSGAIGISGADEITANGETFTNVENLAGSAGADTITIASGATLGGDIDALAGTDALVQVDGANTWTITGTGTGTVTDVGGTFAGVEMLTGGTGTDTFSVTAAATMDIAGGAGADVFDLDAVLTGSTDGEAGADTLQGTQIVDVTLTGSDANGFNGTNAGVTGGFDGIDAIVGTGTLTGSNLASTWTLDGTPTYSDGSSTLAINGFATLQGGSGIDTFNVTSASTFDLLGGAGADVFDLDAVLTGGVDGEAGSDTLQGTQIVDVALTGSDANGFDGTNAGATGGFDGIDVIVGAGTGSLTGDDVASTWTLDGTPTYSNGSNTLAINGFDTLQGGSGIDTFNVTSASSFDLLGGAGADLFNLNAVLTGTLNGEAGSDTLQGTQIVNVTLTGSDANGFDGSNAGVTGGFDGIDAVVGVGSGTLTGDGVASTWTLDGTPTYSDGANTLAINGFDTLQGGSGIDTFSVTSASTFDLLGGAGADVFDLDAVLTGTLNGEAGSDTLQGTQIVNVALTGSTANGFNGTSAGVTGGFQGIDSISGSGTLTGSNLASTWTLDGTPTYSDGVNTLAVAGFGSLQGGSGIDTFDVTSASTFDLLGGAGADVFNLDAVLTGTIDGEAGSDTVTGDDAGNAWTVNADNAGDVDGIAFSGIENLTGGAGIDTFDLAAGVSGAIDGGAGTDEIDVLASFTGPGTQLGLNAETISNSGGGTISVATLNITANHAGSAGAELLTSVDNLSLNVANDAFIEETDTLNISGSVGGNFALLASGDITQGAALAVGGTSAFDSTGGNIVLTHAGNDFATVTVGQAGNVTLVDAGNIDLGAITATGSVNVTSVAGNVSTSGNLSGSGISLTATDGSLVLDNTLTAGNGGVALDAASTRINQAITSSGAVSQAGGSVTLGANITTTGDNITFTGAATLAADVTLDTTSAATIRFADTVSGGGNALALDASGGTARFDGAVSGIGALVVNGGGLADVNADVEADTLNFSGNVDLGDGVDLAASAGGLSVAGTLNLSGTGAGSTVSSSGNQDILVGGISGNRSLTLLSARNISVGGGAGNVNLGAGTANLRVDADGDSANANLAAGSIRAGSVTVAGSGDDVLNVGNIDAMNAVTINSDMRLARSLSVASGGDVTLAGRLTGDTGAGLHVGNTGTFAINGDIALSNAALTLAGPATFSGNRRLSTGSAAMSLADISGDGELSLSSSGALTLSGDVDVDALDVTGMSGGLNVAGTVEIRTDDNAIDLRPFSAVQSAAGGGSLALSAGSASITTGNIGSLDAFTASGSDINVHDVVTSGDQTYNGRLNVNGDLTAGGDVDINGDLHVNADVAIAGSSIVVDGVIDGGNGLALNAAGGNVVVGTVDGLTSFAITAANGRVGTVRTSGIQEYDANMTLGGTLVGTRIDFERNVQVPGNVIVEADAINFNGSDGSVRGTGELTLIPLTDGADVDLGGTSGTLDLDTGALDGYNGGLVIGGIVTEDSITTRAGRVTVGTDFSVGDDGYLTIVSRDGVLLDAGVVSGETITLIAAEQAGTIRNVAQRPADSLLRANNVILVAGGQVGEGSGRDINVASLSGTGILEVGSGSADALVNNVGNTMAQSRVVPRARAIAQLLALPITDVNISSSAQNSANREQSSGLADEGFIDPSLFEDIALYEVSGTGIALPADQSEEEMFDRGPSMDCDSEDESCGLEPPVAVGAVSPY